jgi:hypothetical protein
MPVRAPPDQPSDLGHMEPGPFTASKPMSAESNRIHQASSARHSHSWGCIPSWAAAASGHAAAGGCSGAGRRVGSQASTGMMVHDDCWAVQEASATALAQASACWGGSSKTRPAQLCCAGQLIMPQGSTACSPSFGGSRVSHNMSCLSSPTEPKM